MDAVTKLREILPEVDPALITAEDRLALLDLIAGSFAAGGGGFVSPQPTGVVARQSAPRSRSRSAVLAAG